jgi:hypothetical protein
MCKNCIKVFITITAILSICFSFAISSFAGFNVNVKIFLHDGTTITQLADNDYDNIYHNTSAQINNSGVVVWTGGGEIFLYDGTTKTQLADNDYDSIYHDMRAQINNSGVVVWSGEGEIYLYDGTTVTQLTDNNRYDGSPQINDSGEVVWYSSKIDSGGGGGG